ncbi:hypothetical protein PUR71_03745 [Streptomyces sp. SP17BM10]|nr:hypothetical protein [Streptomyces sp. SP17BM10]MEE1782049.1 hypothetical protein [Streptomyces sp. SP17BM10]
MSTPSAQREEARRVTVPLLFLLQWDDEGNPRQRALDLFDAFGRRWTELPPGLDGWLEIPPAEGWGHSPAPRTA